MRPAVTVGNARRLSEPSREIIAVNRSICALMMLCLFACAEQGSDEYLLEDGNAEDQATIPMCTDEGTAPHVYGLVFRDGAVLDQIAVHVRVVSESAETDVGCYALTNENGAYRADVPTNIRDPALSIWVEDAEGTVPENEVTVYAKRADRTRANLEWMPTNRLIRR